MADNERVVEVPGWTVEKRRQPGKKRHERHLAILLVTSLAACGGGGGGGSSEAFSCAYIPGIVTTQSVSGVCADCTVSNVDAVADANQSTFALVHAGTGQRTTRITDTYSGAAFPSGSNAGALVTLSGNANAAAITFNTYLSGALQETSAATASQGTGGTTAADLYLSFVTTQSFDSLEVVVNAASGSDYQFFEFCGDS